ncbi:MAG TPA: T9SS type A sorting domain-containing protein, partial [Lacibacter sp.]|nr:T9SS type A sorting domain-containing protein [Lacibacter sp.]
TNGFASAGPFIGGETSTTYTDPGGVSHVDFHAYAFDPTNPNRLVVANDGGLQVTDNITATSVAWSTRNGQFQTVQYYHVAIDPTPGSLAFAGGAQDNSTTYRDARGLLAVVRPDPNDHYVLIGGDGGACGLSPSTSTQQFLYGSAQEGDIYRLNLNRTSPSLTYIKPSGSSDGEFITYFHLDQDNTETLYFAAFNEVWRTNNASTVTQFSGWQRMTGIESTLTGSIFALATSRGTYAGSGSYLFIGTTDGKVYRLADPRNAAPGTLPANISPVTGMTNQSLVRHIAVNPRNPDTVMVVVSNYNVQSAFWTGNATSPTPTWQLVQGNLNTPSFRSCAIIPRSTNVEYYVGTSIGLFSTTAINGPSTLWTLEGPPVMQGALINDLALRASDNTLLVGTHGNGMFYTTVPFTTPVSNLIVNDRSFIQSVYPTVAQGSIRYQPGTATGIRSVNIRVFGMSGQTVLQKTSSYSAGELNISQLPAGNYVLEIISDNRQYKHLQKFVKN